MLAGALGGRVSYFSALRPFSELWVARKFAALTQYHGTFRSCNRAFHIDPSRRLDHWCGRCDKCCFIDLILAPFLPAAELAAIFGGAEPLADPPLAGRFQALLGTSAAAKPFECVGDIGECRAAAVLAAARARPGRPHPAAHPGRAAPPAVGCPPWTRCSARSASTGSRMRMRPTICWSDLRGTRAGVWGLGVEGQASLRKLLALGAEPVLVDDHPPAAGPDGRPVLATADGGLAALAGCEVVVKTPGHQPVPARGGRTRAARRPVAGGLGPVAGRGRPRPGGLHHRHQGQEQHHGHRRASAGPARLPLPGGREHRPAALGSRRPTARDYDYWVIETSSYQATDLPCSPPVVAVTSLHPDHLDWHGDAETYYRDKLSACHQPGADLTIANGDSDLLRARAGMLGPRVQWVQRQRRSGRVLDGPARPARPA